MFNFKRAIIFYALGTVIINNPIIAGKNKLEPLEIINVTKLRQSPPKEEPLTGKGIKFIIIDSGLIMSMKR